MKINSIQSVSTLNYQSMNSQNANSQKLSKSNNYSFQNNSLGLNPANDLTFGYKSNMRKEYKQGLLGRLFDMFGEWITPKNAEVDHIQPKSKGGENRESNYALCSAQQNRARGNDDILQHTTLEKILEFLKQFLGLKGKKFDGDEWLKSIQPNLDKQGIDIDTKKLTKDSNLSDVSKNGKK